MGVEATGLAVSGSVPEDALVDAVGVTQDGWIRFTGGHTRSPRDESGELVPVDVYRLHRLDTLWSGRTSADLRIERYVEESGRKFYLTHQRKEDGTWGRLDGESKTLTAAKVGYRLHRHDGTSLQAKFIELRRRQYAQSIGVRFAEYVRRYAEACARSRKWDGKMLTAEERAVLDKTKLDYDTVERRTRRVIREAKLDLESIRAAQAKVIREAGLDDESVHGRRVAAWAAAGLRDIQAWPPDAVRAWHVRAKDFVGFFGEGLPWDGRGLTWAASEAAVQEFPELWS